MVLLGSVLNLAHQYHTKCVYRNSGVRTLQPYTHVIPWHLVIQLCVCSICRKVGGAMGSINLGAHSKTLNIKQGKNEIKQVPFRAMTFSPTHNLDLSC
jgi:hypothetical protein